MPIRTPIQVSNIQAREFKQMEWSDPQEVLANLRLLELNLPADMDEQQRRLRTNQQKELREGRYAALFAYGIGSQVLNCQTLVSKTERRDFDAVIGWQADGHDYFYPLQIKELPPDDINPDVSLDDIYNKLEKYSGQDDLSVVICLNRNTRVRFQPWDRKSKPRIKELWYLGSTDVYQSRWFLYGSVLEKNPRRFEFEYPEGEPTISIQDINQILQQG